MIMRKSLWIVEAVFLLLLLAGSTITVHADPSIIISDYELSPSVFLPGDVGTLKLTVTNAEATNTVATTTTDGSTSTVRTDTVGATIKEISITPAYDGDRQIRATGKYEDIGELAPGASVDISFKIKVENNVSEGVYFLIANIDVRTYEDGKFPIQVTVSNDSVELIPSGIPSTISMSGATDISFSVINTRESSVSSVTVTPRVTSGIAISPATMVLESLAAGSSEDVDFSLIPSETGRKNLTFDLTYNNGENDHSSSSSVTVSVVDTLDVAPIIYSMPSTIEVGEQKSIKLKLYNAKTEDIASVIVTPVSDARVTPSQYFIGAMDADDVYSVSFDVDTSGLRVNQTYAIGFSVSFKQDGTTYETPAVMSSFTIVPNDGGSDELAMAVGVVLVMVIVGLYLFYRWRKKKRMKTLMSKQE